MDYDIEDIADAVLQQRGLENQICTLEIMPCLFNIDDNYNKYHLYRSLMQVGFAKGFPWGMQQIIWNDHT